MQGNVRRLIELQSQTIADNYEFTSFGEELSKAAASGPFNPWRFASKRFDPELGLIYFGKRYYDPEFARWLTPDPAGFIDSVNLYQYVLNNPFRYRDPHGQFAVAVFAIPLLMLGAELALPSLSAVCVPIISSLLTSAVVYGGYKAVQVMQASGYDVVFNPLERASINKFANQYQDSYAMQKKKKGGVDAKLSENPFNDPKLEDVSHPKAKEKGHHQLKDKETGEIVHLDEGRSGDTGHEA